MARFVFFGTPEFAVPSLTSVIRFAANGGHTVEGVVCQPDKPKGRGHNLTAPPTKVCALEHGIPVLQPTTLKQETPDGETFFRWMQDRDLTLAVVAAYGRILPGRVLRLPKFGCVNVHGSLLPRWRGAAPVQRAIEAGDDVTGVCLMDMVYQLDAGDVFVRATERIDDDDDSETLGVRLAGVGARLLTEHLGSLAEGRLAKESQSNDGVTYARMLEKAEAAIDFSSSSDAVRNHCRAMSPWPGSTFRVGIDTVKAFIGANVSSITNGAAPGTIVKIDDDGVHISCGVGSVCFHSLQAPSKTKQPAATFLKSRNVDVGAMVNGE